MRRFLKLASYVPMAAARRYNIIGMPSSASSRLISISSAYSKQRDSSPSSRFGNDKQKGLKSIKLPSIGEKLRQATESKQPSRARSPSIRRQKIMSPGGRSTSSSDRGRSSQRRLSSQGDMQDAEFGPVRHDKNSQRFILDLGNDKVARIDYKPIGRNKLELYHTEVPEELRGRGIGKKLAKGTLECASKSNYKIKVTCEYLEDYINRFADDKHKKLVVP